MMKQINQSDEIHVSKHNLTHPLPVIHCSKTAEEIIWLHGFPVRPSNQTLDWFRYLLVLLGGCSAGSKEREPAREMALGFVLCPSQTARFCWPRKPLHLVGPNSLHRRILTGKPGFGLWWRICNKYSILSCTFCGAALRALAMLEERTQSEDPKDASVEDERAHCPRRTTASALIHVLGTPIWLCRRTMINAANRDGCLARAHPILIAPEIGHTHPRRFRVPCVSPESQSDRVARLCLSPDPPGMKE